MSKLTRREFITGSMAGVAGFVGNKLFADSLDSRPAPGLDRVVLGETGIQVSRLAFGTGTNGWDRVSDQTRLGTENLVELFRHAYDAGITFFDVADIYGSHEYLRYALKHIPRDKIVIVTKTWPKPVEWRKKVDVKADLDRFRREIGTDYLDIVLLHCMQDADWPEKLERQRDVLSEAKQKGIIRAHGCSCHSVDGLRAAAQSPWVEIVFARINNTGARMDDKPDVVLPVIQQVHKAGKGVVGMKIFGCGKLTGEKQREASLKYVVGSQCVDAMTIGFVDKGQIDDTIKRLGVISIL